MDATTQTRHPKPKAQKRSLRSAVEPKHGVTVSAKAFLTGLFFSDLALALFAGPISISVSSHTATTAVAATANSVVLLLLFGSPFVLAFDLMIGIPLACVLRPVRSQWIHIAAFFAAATLAGLIFGPLIAVITGLAAAIGRLSIWKLVKIHPSPTALQPAVHGTAPRPTPGAVPQSLLVDVRIALPFRP